MNLLKMIELNGDFLERLPAELSGGQKQRICIARALAAVLTSLFVTKLHQVRPDCAGRHLKLLLSCKKSLV